MAGGTWTTQNKVLPGVYTNFMAKTADNGSGAAGIVAMALPIPWLADHAFTVLYPDYVKAYLKDFGEAAYPIREALRKSKKLLLYRLNTGTKAAGTIGNLVCTAKFPGTFGNKVTVAVEAVVGEATFYVLTYVSGEEMDSQRAADISGLTSNDWIDFSSTGTEKTLTATAGLPLTGGADGAVTLADYTKFMEALELQTFSTVACISNDADVKALFVSFTKRMMEDEGKYFQTVIPDIAADFEGILSVKNGVKLSNGTVIDKVKATAFVAGASASAAPTDSLTNFQYPDAVDVDTRYTTRQQEDFANSGQLIFIPDADGSVHIQKDINTLVTLTELRPYAFTKNKVIRTLFAIANKIREIGKLSFIGKMPNTANSRELLRSAVYEYFRELQNQSVLKNATSDDITVKQGEKIDSIVVEYIVRPVDTIDIIYNTITVES